MIGIPLEKEEISSSAVPILYGFMKFRMLIRGDTDSCLLFFVRGEDNCCD